MAAETSSTPWIGRPFAIALTAWALVAVACALGFSWVLGLAPGPSLVPPVFIIYLACPLVFEVYALSGLLRGRWRMALSRSACVIVTVGLLFVAGDSLFEAGNRLHFAAQRRAYDAVVADLRGRAGSIDARLLLSGHGVRYRVESLHPLEVFFPWSEDEWANLGVAYDERACPRPPHSIVTPDPSGELPPQVLSGNLYRRHFGGHYCEVGLIG